MKKQVMFLLMLLSLGLAMVVSAQEIVPHPEAEIPADANIIWPPPVYVLRGDVELIGTANLPDMTNFFIEFRPLEFPLPDAVETEEDEDELPWFPVTLPDNNPVIEDVLGSWNTETTQDGLYEIRLSVNVRNQPTTYFMVSPLRVENEAPEFAGVDVDPTLAPLPTLIPSPTARPTLPPSPTAVDTTPRITTNLNANIRSGDSTQYPTVGTLSTGTVARIIGISSSGSGWYFIELANGDRVWIAPSVVTVSGSTVGLPFINPPPPPATPTPTATATPIAAGNLTGSAPSLSVNPPVCGQPYVVSVNITNSGTAQTSAPATVTFQDVHVATNQVQASVSQQVTQLNPGENFVVTANFTISTFYNEEHRIVVSIDSGNTVAETNELDNTLTALYTLQKGECP